MNIIIYESSSHGGCYKYAIELYHAYRQHPEVKSVVLLLPENAAFEGEGVVKVLIPDNKTGNRWHFFYRQFVNPLRLIREARKQEVARSSKLEAEREERKEHEKDTISDNQAIRNLGTPPFFTASSFQLSDASSFLLLNDFEQISAPLWSPLFRLFLRQFKIGVFLHDADRDAYPPTPRLSGYCMRQMMKAMDLALYHSLLPQRNYYQQGKRTHYLKVAHGIYHSPEADKALLADVNDFTARFDLALGIIGHIRYEKNYGLAMQALAHYPTFGLVIAGSAANSQVDVEGLKREAQRLQVTDQILWIDRYLSEAEMTAVITAIDWVLLYYASTFHAQSGILNQTAPLRKPVLVSDLPNALTETVDEYGLGIKCKADDLEALINCFSQLNVVIQSPQWDRFFEEVDWKRQVEIVVRKLGAESGEERS
jgi:hypothetical protein